MSNVIEYNMDLNCRPIFRQEHKEGFRNLFRVIAYFLGDDGHYFKCSALFGTMDLAAKSYELETSTKASFCSGMTKCSVEMWIESYQDTKLLNKELLFDSSSCMLKTIMNDDYCDTNEEYYVYKRVSE